MPSIRSFGVERIGALSDGVVAIALTLLVLDVKIPEEAGSEAILWLRLKAQVPELTAWVISFVVIALVWYDQHYLFAHSERIDSGFLSTTLMQLGAVSLIPLGSHLIGRFPDDVLAVAVFSSIMLINGLMMSGNAWYLSRHTGLHGKPEARFLHRRAVYHATSFPVVAGIAVLVAELHHPLIGTLIWAVKPLTFAAYHAAHNRFLDRTATHQTLAGGT